MNGPDRMTALFFYLFSAVDGRHRPSWSSRPATPCILCCILILAFVNAAGLFLLVGAEFLAMILIVVYVGAVAVLFLFVIMMLDVDFARTEATGFLQYLPLGALDRRRGPGRIGARCLGSWTLGARAILRVDRRRSDRAEAVSNTAALGRVLYTQLRCSSSKSAGHRSC